MPPWLLPLAGLLKPLVEWFQTTGYALLEKLLIYRKGAKDQRTKDDLARVEREARETSRASKRIEEARREQMEDEADGRRPGADTIRVRKPGSDIKW